MSLRQRLNKNFIYSISLLYKESFRKKVLVVGKNGKLNETIEVTVSWSNNREKNFWILLEFPSFVEPRVFYCRDLLEIHLSFKALNTFMVYSHLLGQNFSS